MADIPKDRLRRSGARWKLVSHINTAEPSIGWVMHLHHDSTVSKLDPRELHSVTITDAMRFRCIEGSVWITQHCEVEDLIVEQGTCVILVKKGVVLLQALRTKAAYTLEPLIGGVKASAAFEAGPIR